MRDTIYDIPTVYRHTFTEAELATWKGRALDITFAGYGVTHDGFDQAYGVIDVSSMDQSIQHNGRPLRRVVKTILVVVPRSRKTGFLPRLGWTYRVKILRPTMFGPQWVLRARLVPRNFQERQRPPSRRDLQRHFTRQ